MNRFYSCKSIWLKASIMLFAKQLKKTCPYCAGESYCRKSTVGYKFGCNKCKWIVLMDVLRNARAGVEGYNGPTYPISNTAQLTTALNKTLIAHKLRQAKSK